MNKRIREAFDSWDLKSLFLTIFFISAGGFIYYYFSDIRDRLRTNKEEVLKGQTQGQIIAVQKAERITQSKWNGTKIFIDSYRFTIAIMLRGRVLKVSILFLSPQKIKNC